MSTREPLEFQPSGRRKVLAAFDAGRVSSEGGLLLLREVAEQTGLLQDFAACFCDHRDPSRVEHSVTELVAQRVLALCCGYEDLNDHDILRDDALLATAVGKRDVKGETRARGRDAGHPLAGRSTLMRLEHGGETESYDPEKSRYARITHDPTLIENFFVRAFLKAHPKPPAQLILDIDPTDIELHGKQEGRYFHGYYDEYCYLPMYVFCGSHLLAAKLQTADVDPARGAVEELERVISQIQRCWPDVEIILRADSGFARDYLMDWCERCEIHYVIGLARNTRLQAELSEEMALARTEAERTQAPARVFRDFRYQTKDSWSRERRVVGKAEYLGDKENPRFVVTDLPAEDFPARALYEDLYCARGDMENRIKEQQLGMFADRASAHAFAVNQMRVWLSAAGYVLINALREAGLRDTELKNAQVSTIRCRLLKIGAIVRASVRRIYVSLSSTFPFAQLFAQVLANLQRGPPCPA